MLTGAEFVIGGTRLNRAGYPQQNPALITKIVRKKLSSPCNDKIKLVSEFYFHFNHQMNIRTTGSFHHMSIEEVLEKRNDKTAHLTTAFSPPGQADTFRNILR